MEICACLSQHMLELSHNVNILGEDLTNLSGSDTINVNKLTPVSGQNPVIIITEISLLSLLPNKFHGISTTDKSTDNLLTTCISIVCVASQFEIKSKP